MVLKVKSDGFSSVCIGSKCILILTLRFFTRFVYFRTYFARRTWILTCFTACMMIIKCDTVCKHKYIDPSATLIQSQNNLLFIR